MTKTAYRLKGHESFVPREGWITKGLYALNNDPSIFSRNYGADELGVGTNMAKSIRYWLRAMGLTEDIPRIGTKLTTLGNLIFENDSYLENTFTLWILHANLARNFALATSWNIFFNSFDLHMWKREEMISIMSEYIIEKTGDLSPSERSIRDDCSAILSMYTMNDSLIVDPEETISSPFNSLGLIRKTGQTFERMTKSFQEIEMYPVLFVIADTLNEDKYLNIDEIVNGDNMPGKLFSLNRIHVNNALDALEAAGHITVNRTAGLDVVYPKSGITSEQAVLEFYSHNSTDGEYII